jgi:thiamine biosynthesis lipoprotein
MLALLLSAGLGLTSLAWPLSDKDAAGKLSRFEFVETHMGSSFKILLYCADEPTARRASRLAFDRIAALDAILSDYQPESELSRLSQRAGGAPTAVSTDLFDVLERSKKLHERTGGVFDVTIAPVGRLWRRARREHKLPDPERIAQARALVGSDRLLLDPKHHTVALLKPGMKLDVGGIAKGYAAQAAVDALRKLGITRALVGGAGDIVVGDPPPDAQGWTVAVASLNPRESEPETYLLLKYAAISTAGDAERFVILGGRRYSHIINPVTGAAVEDRASVTVVAPDGATADALETSVYLLGPERGLKLIEETPGAAALYVRATPSGIQKFESSRFKSMPRAKPHAAKPHPEDRGTEPPPTNTSAAGDESGTRGRDPGAPGLPPPPKCAHGGVILPRWTPSRRG